MTRTTIAGLAARFGLDGAAAGRLECLAEQLAADAAPSTLTETPQVLDGHLADSLVALALDHVPWDGHIADLGSGAGVPGLPLAAALPESPISVVESNTRKCEFLRGVARHCELANVAVVRERAELWRAGIGDCDVVTARALAALPVVAEYAAPLLRIGGALVAWRGRRDRVEETMGATAAAELGLEPLDVIEVAPYPGALHRHLHVMIKVAPTPPRFPRRPGIARKHPLGRGV